MLDIKVELGRCVRFEYEGVTRTGQRFHDCCGFVFVLSSGQVFEIPNNQLEVESCPKTATVTPIQPST